MLTKINGIFIVVLGVVIGIFSFRVHYLQRQIELKDSTIALRDATIETAKLSLASVTQINKELNVTIDSLTQHLKEERAAVDYIKTYNASVDAKVNEAVIEIKGLLKNDENTCGSQRLPQSVIDRMWEYYRPKRGD